MTEAQAKQAISDIEAMFGRTYPEGSRALLVSGLTTVAIAAMIETIKALESGDINTLPAPKLLVKMVGEKAASIREQEAARAKRQHEQAQETLTRPASQPTDIGKKTCHLIRALMTGDITRREYLDGIRHLDKLFPLAGFATEGGRIKKRYEERGYDLGKKAGSENGLMIGQWLKNVVGG